MRKAQGLAGVHEASSWEGPAPSPGRCHTSLPSPWRSRQAKVQSWTFLLFISFLPQKGKGGDHGHGHRWALFILHSEGEGVQLVASA